MTSFSISIDYGRRRTVSRPKPAIGIHPRWFAHNFWAASIFSFLSGKNYFRIYQNMVFQTSWLLLLPFVPTIENGNWRVSPRPQGAFSFFVCEGAKERSVEKRLLLFVMFEFTINHVVTSDSNLLKRFSIFRVRKQPYTSQMVLNHWKDVPLGQKLLCLAKLSSTLEWSVILKR